jgi:hypothetical protein
LTSFIPGNDRQMAKTIEKVGPGVSYYPIGWPELLHKVVIAFPPAREKCPSMFVSGGAAFVTVLLP